MPVAHLRSIPIFNKITFLAVAAISLLPTAWSQQVPSERRPRPRIGLALEGGGALGLAHVGLLEWLAEHHIPVDYVAGASMGGLVGGFFASGMTPSEMHRLVDTLDWDQLVTAGIDDSRMSFRRKEDIRRLGNETEVGLRRGLVLPTGLNSGQQLDLLLSRIAAPYDELRSFDDLPTPFRCMATDLVSARSHVFSKGSLATALRATVSIPGLFAPVIDGNREFVDGGLLNNLPVDLVKAMGADIVIAVYLATDPFDASKPQTLVTVLSRSLSAVIAAQERHSIEEADLLVTINLSGLTTSDFSQYPDMIRRGFAGAEKKSAVLSKFAVSDTEWGDYLTQRQAKRKTKIPTPQFVEVTGVNGGVAQAIRGYFAEDIGQPFSEERVRAQIDRAMGNRNFDFIAYDVEERDGKSGLVIHVHPTASKPPALQLAVMVDGADYRIPRLALAGRLTFTNLGGFRSEWRNTFTAGSTYGISSEYFRPLRPLSNWFIAPRIYASTEPLDFYRRSHMVSLNRRRDAGGAVDFGFQTGNKGEFRIGYETSRVATSYRLGDRSVLPEVHGRYGASRISYAFDDVDNDVVPHRGVLARTDFRWMDANPGASHGMPVLDGKVSFFLPVSASWTGFMSVGGGTTFQRENAGIPMFYLGGPQRLSAYGLNEFYGNQFVAGRAGFLKQLAVISTLTNNKAYFLAEYEAGKMYDFRNSTRMPMDVNAGLVVQTLLGPLFLGGSVGDAGHRKWYFQVGPVF